MSKSETSKTMHGPNSAEDYYNEGMLLFHSGSHADAIKNFGQALKIDPHNKTIEIAQQNAIKAMLDEIINSMSETTIIGETLSRDPNNADAHYITQTPSNTIL